jgi:ubiquinone/menaquinone biosynthesis C-methylase UbiE
MKKTLSQRKQYSKGGIAARYWDHRDHVIFSKIHAGSQSILDAGCGEGITLEKLRKQFPENKILGIDLSLQKVTICRSFGLDAIQGDLSMMSIRDNMFDTCILSEVIEHLSQFEQVLGEIRRILKRGGRLIVVIPNDWVFFIARILFCKFKEAFYKSGHVRQWTPKTLVKTLQTEGFQLISQTKIPFRYWPISLHAVVAVEKKQTGIKTVQST